MDAIHRHVIFEVLKFIPYENARNLLTTHKSWLAPLKTQLEKQRTAMTVGIERLEESYRTLRILQVQCKERYVNLENQMERAAANFQGQISRRQTAPIQRHPQNVQSINQHLQDLQNLRPDFDAANLELSKITANVQALNKKINRIKETLGLEQKNKKYHYNEDDDEGDCVLIISCLCTSALLICFLYLTLARSLSFQ